jgi:DNA-binding transcriptional ArsR family regulator
MNTGNKSDKHMESLHKMADALRAASHPERLAIMDLMRKHDYKPMNVKTIYVTLGLEQPVVSRHLGILRRSGLLRKEGGGNYSTYQLNIENRVANVLINCLKDD